MDPSPPLDADRLLEHVAWVRRLAGQLVRDPEVADDAAQDAFAAALRSGPREASRTKAWFAAVVRSFVRRAARSEERRTRREEGAAQTERVDSTAEIVERAQASRVVVDAVLALPEPYRTTVLMRWFDDVPTARIAELRGEPVETVRTRLKRGHALLREWLSGLQALVVLAEPSRSAAVVAGGFVMTTLGKMAIGAVAVAAVSATTWALRSPAPTRGETPVARADAPQAAPASPVPAPQAAPVAAAAVTQEAVPAPTPAAANASRWDDVTAANWKKLVKDDEGRALHLATDGLETETLELAVLLQYFADSLDDSVAVPGTEAIQGRGDNRSVTWVQVYENSAKARSAVKASWSKSPHEEAASLAFPVGFWVREQGPQLDLSPTQIDPVLYIQISNFGSYGFGGFVKLTLQPAGETAAELAAVNAKLADLREQQRLPSIYSYQFKEGIASRHWTRSKTEYSLGPVEIERLTALLDRLAKTAAEFVRAAQPEPK